VYQKVIVVKWLPPEWRSMGPNERIYKEAVRPVVQPSQGVTATCKWLLKIWLILGHSFYPSDDLDFWPFDHEIGVQCRPWYGQPSRQFLCLYDFPFELWANTCQMREVITLSFDLWRHRACRWCESSYSKCEVRGPSHSEDMADFRSWR